MSREREGSGISLQNMSGEVQMALLDKSQDHEVEVIERKVLFVGGVVSRCEWGAVQLPANVIRNQKYSLLTFVPVVLYEQFKYFFNLFYLLTALSQFIPILKVGLLFSFVAPLALVLILTMMKEAYEDVQRYRKDKEINSAMLTKVEAGNRIPVQSCDLKMGDLLQVGVGDSIPADCLLISSLTDKPSVFIKTDQLDGQTDWKLRKPQIESLNLQHVQIQFTTPVVNIYEFIGSMRVDEGERVGLGLEQTLWRGVKVASGRGLVMVLYTGKETKLSLNSKESGNKFGKLDEQLNNLSKILFVIMLGLSIMLIILRGSYGSPGESFILLFKYFLLLSSIIPISMRVNLDFAKLLYKYHIDRDPLMPGCQCRNSNIPEELGRITYVLSDKTGTLTQNEMIFRKLLLSNDLAYEPEDVSELKQILKEEVDQHERNARTKEKRSQDAILSLILCHNVTPVFDKQVRILQGSSPDEITLVSFAQSIGYHIIERDQSSITLKNPNDEEEIFEILELFPFTSQSKSMGIVVRKNDRIIYYLKGADSVMQSRISQADAHFMAEACLDLAREGLRTLVVAQKNLTKQYYESWKKDFKAANASLKNRDQKIGECKAKLERNMTFVTVTGVQDKLQEGVVQTVGSLRSIGIKVWMLTGDKVETAICVGRAVKLIQGREQKLFIVENMKTRGEFMLKLDEFYQFAGLDRGSVQGLDLINCVLVIDGVSLRWALEEVRQEFFQIAVKLPAIICSRVSPTQKAEVSLLVRQFGSGRVLGIGDGGNDVALIQSAHVGVGIYGKEGIQAALASDFSIAGFQQLNGLIYWHGRLAYKRSSLLAQFIIHRGTIITIMQTIFTIQFFFVAIPIYNGFLLLGYSTLFTMLPVFSLVLDQDISRTVAMEYPILYRSTQAGNELNATSFIYWIFISIYQGAIIMILIDVLLGQQSFYMVSTISFTCLILIEFLNVFTEIHRLKYAQLISIILSLVLYLGTIFLMRNILNGIQLFSSAYLPATFFIVGCAWAPPFLYELIKRLTNPSEEQKIMSQSSSLEV